jgi:chromosome segregation ATPase
MTTKQLQARRDLLQSVVSSRVTVAADLAVVESRIAEHSRELARLQGERDELAGKMKAIDEAKVELPPMSGPSLASERLPPFSFITPPRKGNP